MYGYFLVAKQHNITQVQCYVMSVTMTSRCNISVGGKGVSGGGLFTVLKVWHL